MRHQYDRPHLNRTSAHRHALAANMAAALFTHRRIVTTLAKARFARRFAERMITFARRNDLAARRHVLSRLPNEDAVRVLFDKLGPHFKNRNGGYTRIIKLGLRRGDAAPMALLELVGYDDVAAHQEPTKPGKSRLKTAAARSKGSKAADKAKPESPAHEETKDSKSEN